MLSILINKIVKTGREGYEYLVSIYDEIISQDDRDINLDFSKCRHFDANLSSALGAIFDSLKEDGYTILLTDFNSGVLRTLTRNRFLKGIGYNILVEEDKETFIPYRRFTVDEADSFKQYINEELIGKQKFPKHTESAGEYISTNIFEIFVNAIYHGNCGYIYCCGEYDPSDKIPKLHMTIADCGRTMYTNVCDHFKLKGINELITPDSAIEWAIKEGNTTKSTTGGLGLAYLMDFIKMNKGAVHIVSSYGVLIYKNDEVQTYLLEKAFPGTIVNMEFNFNDNKLYYMSNEKIDLDNLL